MGIVSFISDVQAVSDDAYEAKTATPAQKREEPAGFGNPQSLQKLKTTTIIHLKQQHAILNSHGFPESITGGCSLFFVLIIDRMRPLFPPQSCNFQNVLIVSPSSPGTLAQKALDGLGPAH